MSGPPLFSDLKGVTVRNTFLEFEDTAADRIPDSGFARQVSEPAKPFNRQVSEQTTTGSGGTLEDTTELEESHAGQLAACLARAGVQAEAAIPQPQVTMPSAPAAFGLPEISPFPGALPVPVPRFCPNCGNEAEPNHRFCPYCCFQLQWAPAASNATTGISNDAVLPLTGLTQNPTVALMAPHFLSYLRRFRYIEAKASDVELARVFCMDYLSQNA